MYCKKVCGDPDFSIEEWNKEFKRCLELGIQPPKIIEEPCKTQCFDCIAIVGERRLKTKKIIDQKP